MWVRRSTGVFPQFTFVLQMSNFNRFLDDHKMIINELSRGHYTPPVKDFYGLNLESVFSLCRTIDVAISCHLTDVSETTKLAEILLTNLLLQELASANASTQE